MKLVPQRKSSDFANTKYLDFFICLTFSNMQKCMKSVKKVWFPSLHCFKVQPNITREKYSSINMIVVRTSYHVVITFKFIGLAGTASFVFNFFVQIFIFVILKEKKRIERTDVQKKT